VNDHEYGASSAKRPWTLTIIVSGEVELIRFIFLVGGGERFPALFPR